MLPNQRKALLVLRRSRILHPEQVIRLQRLAQPRRLNRSQPVMHIMQQVHILTNSLPQLLKQLRREVQVSLGWPQALARQSTLRRLVRLAALRHTIA